MDWLTEAANNFGIVDMLYLNALLILSVACMIWIICLQRSELVKHTKEVKALKYNVHTANNTIARLSAQSKEDSDELVVVYKKLRKSERDCTNMNELIDKLVEAYGSMEFGIRAISKNNRVDLAVTPIEVTNVANIESRSVEDTYSRLESFSFSIAFTESELAYINADVLTNKLVDSINGNVRHHVKQYIKEMAYEARSKHGDALRRNSTNTVEKC